MIPAILTNPIVLIVAIILFYCILAFPLMRVIRDKYLRNGDIYYHDVYTDGQDTKYDHKIETSLCDFCLRIDIIHLTTERLKDICSESNIGVGEMTIRHDSHETFSHKIRYFFDDSSNFLGGRIPVTDLKEMLGNVLESNEEDPYGELYE